MAKEITCDVCGQTGFKKMSAMKAHKRWKHEGKHPGGSVSASQQAELAEYQAVKRELADMAVKLDSVMRAQAQAQAQAVRSSHQAVVSEPAQRSGGLSGVAVAVLVALAWWASRGQQDSEPGPIQAWMDRLHSGKG